MNLYLGSALYAEQSFLRIMVVYAKNVRGPCVSLTSLSLKSHPRKIRYLPDGFIKSRTLYSWLVVFERRARIRPN